MFRASNKNIVIDCSECTRIMMNLSPRAMSLTSNAYSVESVLELLSLPDARRITRVIDVFLWRPEAIPHRVTSSNLTFDTKSIVGKHSSDRSSTALPIKLWISLTCRFDTNEF